MRINRWTLMAVLALTSACGGMAGDETEPEALFSGAEQDSELGVDESALAVGTVYSAPVYELGEVELQTEAGPQPRVALFREFRKVTYTGNAIRDAVNAMLKLAPLDPDYFSVWSRTARVRSVTVRGDVATVDLTSAAATANAGSEAADRSVQQLVYTVTAANTAVKRVLLKINGNPVNNLWGHVSWTTPIARAPQVDVVAPVWILQPTQGQSVARTFTLSGTATVFEAVVNWELRRGNVVVRSGFATVNAGAPARGPYSVQVTAPAAGTYTLAAFESSPVNGLPGKVDTKVVTVR